jgi:protocatechuate 3,4-dioxygenase beta subunit
LPPREVARRLGVPVETVRTRLKRGHALLRARLDGDYGDDREAWCKALLPFALARPARVLAPHLGGKFGLALGGAAIVASACWFARAPASSLAAASASSASSTATARRVDADVGLVGERSAVESAPRAIALSSDSAHECIASGRVVDADGRAVPGARVVAFGTSLPLLRDGEAVGAVAETTSDDSGQFAVALPSSRFYLHASADENVAVAGFASSLDGVDQLDDIALQLAPSLTVRGHVVDEHGSALAHALVRATTLDRRGPGRSAGREGTSYRALLELSTYSALDGSFELRGLPAAKHFVGASLASYAPAGTECTAATEDLALVLESTFEGAGDARDDEFAAPSKSGVARHAVVSGRVVDAQTREPVTRFMVTVRSPAAPGGEQHRAFDSPDGAFEYAGLAAATSFVAVHSDGYAPWSSRLRDLSSQWPVLAIELAPQRSLDLRVVDARGEPVQHARLVFSSERGRALPTLIDDGYWNDTVIAAPDGRAHIAGLPAEVVQVEVRVPELAVDSRFTFDLRAPLDGERELRVPCDLSSPRRTLVLVLPSGAPAPEGEFHIDVRDATETLVASGVFDVGSDEVKLLRPLRYLVQRFDDSGVLLSSSLQSLDSDSLVRDHGPKLINEAGLPAVSLRVPLGALSISARLADPVFATPISVTSGSADSRTVIVLERWN